MISSNMPGRVGTTQERGHGMNERWVLLGGGSSEPKPPPLPGLITLALSFRPRFHFVPPRPHSPLPPSQFFPVLIGLHYIPPITH